MFHQIILHTRHKLPHVAHNNLNNNTHILKHILKKKKLSKNFTRIFTCGLSSFDSHVHAIKLSIFWANVVVLSWANSKAYARIAAPTVFGPTCSRFRNACNRGAAKNNFFLRIKTLKKIFFYIQYLACRYQRLNDLRKKKLKRNTPVLQHFNILAKPSRSMHLHFFSVLLTMILSNIAARATQNWSIDTNYEGICTIRQQ